MKVLLIPDSFKGSISSEDIIKYLTKGFKEIDSSIEIFSCVASDGGEGFLNSITNQRQCSEILCTTIDPLGRIMDAPYLLSDNNKVAFVELAQASGFELLTKEELNPLKTSTLGTGIQIKHAIQQGATSIYIGLGGSATNDAGLGIASALGYTFEDVQGNVVKPIGENLNRIKIIKGLNAYNYVKFYAINDVSNPLLGAEGAVITYARQKGANTEDMKILDTAMASLSSLVKKQLGFDHSDTIGAGAAGGTAFGLKTFFDAEFISGIDFLFELTNIKELIKSEKIDLVITGEGCIDLQSLKGKLVGGVAKIGESLGVKIIGICGIVTITEKVYKELGLYRVIQIADSSISVEESINNAAYYIEQLPKKIIPILKELLNNS